MKGFIDLHCHWLPGIDDGAQTPTEGVEILQGLRRLGFDTVFATPHMRPGMFDNRQADIVEAFDRMSTWMQGRVELPSIALSCEHFFDDVVFGRLMNGEGLPYPGQRAVLVEFPSQSIPTRIADRFFDLRRKGLRPVLAHPERCSSVWRGINVMEDLVDRGTVLLMDVGALAGKYGRSARKCAEQLLEAGLYYAVCTDAHRTSDVAELAEGIARLRRLVGEEETEFLLIDGPKAVLEGRVDL